MILDEFVGSLTSSSVALVHCPRRPLTRDSAPTEKMGGAGRLGEGGVCSALACATITHHELDRLWRGSCEGHHEVEVTQVLQTRCDGAVYLYGVLEGQEPSADSSLVRQRRESHCQ